MNAARFHMPCTGSVNDLRDIASPADPRTLLLLLSHGSGFARRNTMAQLQSMRSWWPNRQVAKSPKHQVAETGTTGPTSLSVSAKFPKTQPLSSLSSRTETILDETHLLQYIAQTLVDTVMLKGDAIMLEVASPATPPNTQQHRAAQLMCHRYVALHSQRCANCKTAGSIAGKAMPNAMTVTPLALGSLASADIRTLSLIPVLC